MRTAMGDGRFGPVFFADDVEAGRPVVIRVFERVDATVTDALLDALKLLCSSPLDHPAIARALAYGSESGTGKALPFVVHSYLPGTPLDDFLAQRGPQPLDQVATRVAQVAASIDFAAAAGIHHGILGGRDIILSDDGAGVTGFGLVQALGRSGIRVPGAAVSHADDIYALAAIAFQLLTGTRYRGTFDQPLAAVSGADPIALRAALASALAIDADYRPATALELARALQSAVSVSDAVAPPAPAADLAGGARLLLERVAVSAPVAEAETASTAHWRLGDVNTSAVGRSDDVVVVRDHPSFVPAPRVSPAAVLVVVAVVVVAAVGGFAGGFTVAKRTVSTAPADRAPAVAPATSPQPRPEGTQGRAFTEAPIDASPAAADKPVPVPPAPATPAPVTPAPRPAARPETPRVGKPAATASASAPAAATADKAAGAADRPAMTVGSMEVLSRPAGAEVHVDGALVGQTPLTLPNVEPGNHAVRISLPGHQRWATSVVVRPGDRTRVAASLELATDPQ